MISHGTIDSILLNVFTLTVLLSGCKKDEDKSDISLPSNLMVSVKTDTSILGLVELKATAQNTNFYSFSYDENGKITYEETTDGESVYEFKESGEYDIKVKAHVLHDQFIEKIEKVTIDLNPGGDTNKGEYPSSGYTTPLTYAGYNLVWQDEFEGTSLSTQDWNIESGTGNGGWGNNELQHYLSDNLKIENGYLTITAKDETYNTSSYTSSRITTQNNQSFQYGRIDIRAAAPEGQGIWPALWMLGNDINPVGWPKCGEIDIMEMVGGPSTPKRGDDVCHGTLHWADGNDLHSEASGNTKTSSGKLADQFYVYSIVWDSNSIRWYLNDKQYHIIDITSPALSEFHQKFFFVINLAVGGNWPGSPDNSTEFPQNFHIDYVRVFQK